jgi:predicted HicB family RNase H-like nuclease
MEGAEMMMEVAQQTTQEDRIQRVRQVANEKFRHEPDWVTFYREVLGVDGIIDQLFPGIEQRSKFQQTDEFAEIQQMLAKLREKNRGQKQPDEPTRVITVRLPQSLHEALRHEAHNHKTSMNKLCISKLLQVIDGELVPSDFERHEEEEAPHARATRPQPPIQNLPHPRPAAPPVLVPVAAFAPPPATQPSFSPLPTMGSGF